MRCFSSADGTINLGTGNTFTINQSTNTSYSGSFAGNGAKWGTDSREIGDAELIVMWGGNPVAAMNCREK